MDEVIIAGRKIASRLFLGSGKFGSLEVMSAAIRASGTEMVTVALRRVNVGHLDDALPAHAAVPGVRLLPNTSGARSAKEAVLAAELAREALGTEWVKLEIHPDPRYLLPDPIETLSATRELAANGFVVLPYCGADPVLCKQLEEAGAAAVMPLASPIGSNRGLEMRPMLEIIVEQAAVPVVIDAGLGAPSHAAAAMELGADAVLVNTAIAVAGDPVAMAHAFREAVIAGRRGRRAGLASTSDEAEASSPLTAFLDE